MNPREFTTISLPLKCSPSSERLNSISGASTAAWRSCRWLWLRLRWVRDEFIFRKLPSAFAIASEADPLPSRLEPKSRVCQWWQQVRRRDYDTTIAMHRTSKRWLPPIASKNAWPPTDCILPPRVSVPYFPHHAAHNRRRTSIFVQARSKCCTPHCLPWPSDFSIMAMMNFVRSSPALTDPFTCLYFSIFPSMAWSE